MASPEFQNDSGAATHGGPIADVSGTAGATYTAAEQTLINSLATNMNEALAALRSANIIG